MYWLPCCLTGALSEPYCWAGAGGLPLPCCCRWEESGKAEVFMASIAAVSLTQARSYLTHSKCPMFVVFFVSSSWCPDLKMEEVTLILCLDQSLPYPY